VTQIIEVLASSPRRGLTALDVAGHLHVSKQAATRLLEGMVKSGLASRDPATRYYRLSLQSYVWSRKIAQEHSPSEAVRREMVNLAKEADSVVIYGILDGMFAVGLEQAEWLQEYALVTPSNRAGVWYISLSGKTLVSLGDPESRKSYLSAFRATDASERATLLADMELIQRDGMGLDQSGDSFRAAVPIRNLDNFASASLLVVPRRKGLIESEKQRVLALSVQAAVRCSAGTEPDDASLI